MSRSSARPCDLAWIRSIVKQCREAGVPCFVKQLGAKPVRSDLYAAGRLGAPVRLRDRKGGDVSEFPSDLRVREFPEVGR